MNLDELKNKSILLFGKSRAFSSNEFEDQMRFYDISVVKEYNDDVVLAVDGRMMTPYEQNESDELYESKKAPSISIDILEKELAKHINEETLLMSLKLSHEKGRLKSFLQNTTISDELFLRLLKIYSWSGEDFFENDDNRDVTAALISRFYENIERNHNVQYATTGLIHLVAQTKSVELLQTISELKPLKFHPKIKYAIAMSIYCDEPMQKRLYKTGEDEILEALSFNKFLSKSLVEKYLSNERFASNIAKSINLDDELFELLSDYTQSLARNENLSLEMQEKLLSKNIQTINYALSLNNKIDKKIIEILLGLDDENIKLAVYENSSTPIEILEEAYKDSKYHLSLSKNENTPIEILYQLQLDSRYERYVKTNPAFGKHIQSENIGWQV